MSYSYVSPRTMVPTIHVNMAEESALNPWPIHVDRCAIVAAWEISVTSFKSSLKKVMEKDRSNYRL